MKENEMNIEFYCHECKRLIEPTKEKKMVLGKKNPESKDYGRDRDKDIFNYFHQKCHQWKKDQVMKGLTDEELSQELRKREKTQGLSKYEIDHACSGCSHCGEEFDGDNSYFKRYEGAWYCSNCYDDMEVDKDKC